MKDSPLWGNFVVVPTPIATQFLDQKNRRVIVTYNDSIPYHQALMPDGNGGFFLTVNKEIRKSLELHEGMDITISIRKDHSKYGMAMPEEFSELLKLDIEGSNIFHALTLGKQRTLIHLVAKNKGSDTRIKKALVILNYIKAVNGVIDFKELNQAFKNSTF